MASAPHTRRPRPSAAGPRGVTLIEILVVITIIVILAALLIPALGAAKRHARATDNLALLTGIADAVEAYNTDFNAYPGSPLAGMTTVTSNKMSGAQALLLALSYAWVDSSAAAPNDANTVFGTTSAPPIVPFNGSTGNIAVDPAKMTGPIDHANAGPTGAFRSFQPFFTPGTRELAPATVSGGNQWPPAGMAGAMNINTFNFPVLMDHYSTPMPILYFRGTPGVSGSITYNAGTGTQNTPPIVADDPTTPASIYRYENIEYLQSSAGLSTSLGTSPGQLKLSPLSQSYDGTLPSDPTPNGGSAATADLKFAELLAGKATSGTVTLTPNFVLMSAGEDRIYGTSDDVIIKR